MTTASPARIALPPAARSVLDALENAGFEAWVVGGFVRDALRGAPSADTDVATAAPWQEVARIFEERGAAVAQTGVAHGTVTVVVNHAPFEITTYRVDGPYADGRHPSYVAPARTIEEDLARRDFTVNAMAYHPDRGLLDPFGGADDLRRGVIRAVGAPEKRMAEDALRILRAARFASQFGFDIDADTERAMIRGKHRLARVSAERVAHELDRLLVGPFAGKALLDAADALSAVLPEIVACRGFDQRNPYHCYDVYEHIARTVDAAPPTRALRWAALCHDLGKPALFFLDDRGQGHFYGHALLGAEIARGIMRRLKLPTRLEDEVALLVAHHDDEIPATPKGVAKAVRALGGSAEAFRALCDLKRADARAHAPDHRDGVAIADQLEQALDEAVAAQEPFSVRDLAIDGRCIIECGIDEGPDVGKALRAALDAVIGGAVENEPDALRRFVAEWKSAKRCEKGVDEPGFDQ